MVAFWIETIIYTQNYWWLRSPLSSKGVDRSVWLVTSSGAVDNDHYFVDNSYGLSGDWA